MMRKPKNPIINRQHPLARGLQMDWLLDEGGGFTIRDLVTRAKMTASGTGVTWANRFGDYGVDIDSSGEYLRITGAPSVYDIPTHGKFSLEVEFTRDSAGSGTGYGTIAGAGQGTSFGDRVWLFENDNGDTGWGQAFQVWWDGQPGIWSIPYPSAGKKHHLVVIYDAGSTSNHPIMILDGVKQTVTQRLNPAGTLRRNITTVAIGNNAEAGGTWDGNVYRLRQWNRLLSLREALSLYANPYRLYQQHTPRGYVSAALGTNMQINIGDSWKGVAGLKINIGDVWKDVVSVKQNIGDTWKDVF